MKNEFNPDWVSPPGDTILEILEEKGMSHGLFANKMHMPPEQADGLLRGTEPLSEEMAEKLHKLFGVDKSFWINWETHYRDGLAAGKKVI